MSVEMKFWQLHAIMGESDDRRALEAQLNKPEWHMYRDWSADFGQLVANQDRAKLDAILPNTLVRDVLRSSKIVFLLYEGWLRLRHASDAEVNMSALAAFDAYGGHALEDTLEKGCYFVGTAV